MREDFSATNMVGPQHGQKPRELNGAFEGLDVQASKIALGELKALLDGLAVTVFQTLDQMVPGKISAPKPADRLRAWQSPRNRLMCSRPWTISPSSPAKCASAHSTV